VTLAYADVFARLRDHGYMQVVCREQMLANHLFCQGRISREEHEMLWMALQRPDGGTVLNDTATV
jgi:hypothetical protein